MTIRRESEQSIEDEWRIAKAVLASINAGRPIKATLRRAPDDWSAHDFEVLDPSGNVIAYLECRWRKYRWGQFPDVWIERRKVHAILRHVHATLGAGKPMLFAVEQQGEVRVASFDLEQVATFDYRRARRNEEREGDQPSWVYKVPTALFKPLRR